MARALHGRLVLLVLIGLYVFAAPAYAQDGLPAEPYLLGDWGGLRTRLMKQGVRFDFGYVSDTLWGFKSQQTPLAMWNRFRATVDIDFGALAGFDGWYFHATGLAQGGGNLGLDLGLVTGPSGLVSANTTRLDSWWIEKRWLDDRIAVRVGQFAGQDFYGNAQFGESFIMSPLNYALGNLSTTLENFNPFATPAAEIRIAPLDHFYLKWMVMAGDPSPATSNPTGLLPQFRGSPVVVSEIGFTPGRKATSRPVDDVESRKGYSGLYQFGLAYNPGAFTAPSAQRQCRATIFCTGRGARLSGASTRREHGAWMRRLRSTGVRRTSIATSCSLRRGCASMSRCLWVFTTPCPWAMSETV